MRGLCDEIVERLEKMDALSPPHLSVQNRIQAQAYDISAYKIVADEMLLENASEERQPSPATAERQDPSERESSGQGGLRQS